MVTITNVHDRKVAYLLMRVLKEMCSGVKVILADGGYRGELIDNVRKKFGYVIQVVISAYKEQGFRLIQKRWIVERTFSWMDYNRRLCRNYELTFDSAEEMVKLATIRLSLRKIKQALTSIDNLCYVVEGLLTHNIPNGIYHMSDDESMSTNELIVTMCEVMDKQPNIWKINKKLMEKCASVGSLLHLPLNTE